MATQAKPKTHRYYRDSNTALNESGVLVRPALLLTEGMITDSDGVTTTYTKELLDAIAEGSNSYMQTEEIKLFNDHVYSQKSRIGSVTGKFSAREISDLDIPENGDRSSIGKYAIFTDAIEIRDEDAIEKYHSKLLKELSVGIVLNGKTGTIIEVSAVPWGAVPEAHIYSGEPDTLKYAFTFESQIRRSDKQYSEEDFNAMNATQKGFSAFDNCMSNINNATDSELPKSRYKCVKNAVTSLSDHLMSIHAPKPDEDVTAIPIVMMEKPKMTEEIATYSAAQIKELIDRDKEKDLAITQLRKDSQDTRKFSALKDKANDLVRTGKLSAAQYKAQFEGDQAFANYQAAMSGDPLEGFLNYLDAHVTPDPRKSPSVYGATPLLDQEVPQRPEAEQKATADMVNSLAAQYAKKASYK